MKFETEVSKRFGDYLQMLHFNSMEAEALHLLEAVYDFEPLKEPGSHLLGEGPLSSYFYRGGEIPLILSALSNLEAPSAKVPPPLPLLLLHLKLMYLKSPLDALPCVSNLYRLSLPSPPTRQNYNSTLQLRKKRIPPPPPPPLPRAYKSAGKVLPKKYKSHNAYFSQICYLLLPPLSKTSPPPPAPTAGPGGKRTVHVVGDSHSLSLHGVGVEAEGVWFQSRVAVGVKMKHFFERGEGTKFFARTIFEGHLNRIEGVTVVVSCGEIDCREGVGGLAVQGFINGEVEWEEVEAEIRKVVDGYLMELEAVMESVGKTAYLMQIPQGRDRAGGRELSRAAKVKTVKAVNDRLRLYRGERVKGLDYDVNDEDGMKILNEFDGDGTHTNTRVAKPVAEALRRATD